jgi:D-alanyl-lipoteichoic acid acyltransferase DltB (MBOAT superfamily)
MLFHSQAFILLFLPSVLVAYYALAHRRGAREWVLLAASLIFYAGWDIRFVPLLLGQCTATWLAAGLHHRSGRRGWLWAGVAVNLSSLAFFKYTGFALSMVAVAVGIELHPPGIVLPVGISFFTFQLATYLVDLDRHGGEPHSWRRVTLFVSLFPHLVAGPIVRHTEIMPQLDADPLRQGVAERIAKGLGFFTIGCVKKVFLADQLAPGVDRIFAQAAAAAPSFGDAWYGALAFSLQLFLDFSAYTEMAIGLGLMLGVRFPDNFDAPYRAGDLRDFWRRWHMTLSRLLRDYLFIPLGGSRHGWRTYAMATLVTMTLCGLWHGAGWTFVAWGLMHGFGLMVCRAWQARMPPLPRLAGWPLTMLFVVAGWVLFRSADFAMAANMFAGMSGLGANLAPTVAFRPEFAVAAAVALLGPTTKSVVEGGLLRPLAHQGVLAGAVLVAVILVVGRGQPQAFIYFQF